MYQKLFENWRSFKKVIKEDVESPEGYGSSFQELMQKIEDSKDKTWIFFDTETTGLKADKDYNQVTQIAAIAVDVKGFKEEPEILEQFNIKVNLAGRTREFMAWERDKEAGRVASAREQAVEVAPGIKRSRKEKNPFKSVPDIFRMTGYGVSRNPWKAERKALASAPEGTSLEDLPPRTRFMHGRKAINKFTEFLDKYPNRILVAQNAPFDVGYMNKFYERVGKPAPNDVVIDTVKIFNKFLVPALKKFKADKEAGNELDPKDAEILTRLTTDKGKLTVSLGKLIHAFNIENKGWHDALADVTMLLDVLKAILNFLETRQDLSSLPPEPDFVPKYGEKPSTIG